MQKEKKRRIYKKTNQLIFVYPHTKKKKKKKYFGSPPFFGGWNPQIFFLLALHFLLSLHDVFLSLSKKKKRARK
jgi:hypothetical protein